MRNLVSIAICSFAGVALSLPALAADEAAKNRAGTNASTEGGASLGGTGVSSGAPTSSGAGAPVTQGTTETQPRSGDNAGAGARTGDTQARRDNVDEKDKDKSPARAEPRR